MRTIKMYVIKAINKKDFSVISESLTNTLENAIIVVKRNIVSDIYRNGDFVYLIEPKKFNQTYLTFEDSYEVREHQETNKANDSFPIFKCEVEREYKKGTPKYELFNRYGLNFNA